MADLLSAGGSLRRDSEIRNRNLQERQVELQERSLQTGIDQANRQGAFDARLNEMERIEGLFTELQTFAKDNPAVVGTQQWHQIVDTVEQFALDQVDMFNAQGLEVSPINPGMVTTRTSLLRGTQTPTQTQGLAQSNARAETFGQNIGELDAQAEHANALRLQGVGAEEALIASGLLPAPSPGRFMNIGGGVVFDTQTQRSITVPSVRDPDAVNVLYPDGTTEIIDSKDMTEIQRVSEAGGQLLGRGGATGDLFTTGFKTDIDQKMASSLDQFVRLKSLAASFNKDYTTFLGRLGAGAANFLEQLFTVPLEDLSPDAAEFVDGMHKFESDNMSLLRDIVRENAGTAWTKVEQDLIMDTIPNLKADGPSKFVAKLETAMVTTKMAFVRNHMLRQNGFDSAEIQEMMQWTEESSGPKPFYDLDDARERYNLVARQQVAALMEDGMSYDLAKARAIDFADSHFGIK